ncbi:deoxyribonuclease-1 isoform X1 [Hydra vulgaris]|uniref:deoxyribonuclease-1 isoform X1 n=1 Tax=Hydra vulgaris TaxID=6087 RepID=UPI001F5F1409|nr:deoxyribonuclease-1 [Hydra vulgaris]
MRFFVFLVLFSCYIKERDFRALTSSFPKTFRIGAFNVQKLSFKKFNDAFVVDNLLKILSRFDIILLQEVQDKDKISTKPFVEKLAKFSNKSFSYILSDYAGRTSYKENYLYIYRDDLFEVSDYFHYDDGPEESQEDTFEREPFIALFKSNFTLVKQFAVIGVHIRPDAVEQEISELINVYKSTINKWKETSVVLMGDFNAGPKYISKKKLDQTELRTDKKFNWLLQNEDTTVSKSHATLDRIIITGNAITQALIKDSAGTFNFDEEYKLTLEDALKISDHYPVKFEISGKQD